MHQLFQTKYPLFFTFDLFFFARVKNHDFPKREMEKIGEQGAVETAGDFDRLVLASPNSSYVWIKYMAYHVSLAEFDKVKGALGCTS